MGNDCRLIVFADTNAMRKIIIKHSRQNREHTGGKRFGWHADFEM